MKAFFVTTIFIFLTGLSVFAQRLAFVDTERILKAIPDYVSAQKQLDALSQGYEKELVSRQAEIDKLARAYRANAPLMTDDGRKRSENEIVEKENELKNFQSVKFGVTGELSQQRDKLIQPIQERVSKAIEAVRQKQSLGIIVDRRSILAADPRDDKSDDVIRQMGLTPVDDK